MGVVETCGSVCQKEGRPRQRELREGNGKDSSWWDLHEKLFAGLSHGLTHARREGSVSEGAELTEYTYSHLKSLVLYNWLKVWDRGLMCEISA